MIYTGYFAKLDRYKANGLIPVSIARFSPKWYIGKSYKTVSPEIELLNAYKRKEITNNQYLFHYITMLNMLNRVIPIYTEIESLGTNIVLLCYEKPSDFCHRHLLCNWLNSIRPGFCAGEFYE